MTNHHLLLSRNFYYFYVLLRNNNSLIYLNLNFMKKIYLLTLAIVAVVYMANAQYKISSGSNAFVAGDKHDFVFVTPVSEGVSGKNVTWDYRNLQKTAKTLTTNMSGTAISEKAALVPQANLIAEEGGNLFLFKVTKDGMEHCGTINNCSVTRFDKTMVKLKFPFKYGDAVSGEYAGVTITQDNKEYKVSGTYEVVADAYGTLLLPGDLKIKNVLRVKQTRTFSGSDLKEITYRWYAQGARYPYLVVIKYESAAKTYVSETALFAHAGEQTIPEENVIAENNITISSVEVFPNPFKGKLNINFKVDNQGKVRVDLLDANGKVVKTCMNKKVDKGFITESIELDKNKVGTYFVRVAAGDKVITKKVIMQ
jgi:co-chaperonin GroES (HSP10)